MLEYESVLKRPEHLIGSGPEAKDIDALLDGLATVLEPVRLSFLWRPDLRHLEAGLKRFGIRAVRPGVALEILRDKECV